MEKKTKRIRSVGRDLNSDVAWIYTWDAASNAEYIRIECCKKHKQSCDFAMKICPAAGETPIEECGNPKCLAENCHTKENTAVERVAKNLMRELPMKFSQSNEIYIAKQFVETTLAIFETEIRAEYDMSKVNRVEVINHNRVDLDLPARAYVYWDTKNESDVTLSFQDNRRTLKVFIEPRTPKDK